MKKYVLSIAILVIAVISSCAIAKASDQSDVRATGPECF